MIRVVRSLTLCVLAVFWAIAPAMAQNKPRQIILILADDLGWKDVGFNGSRYYQTPALDSLAARSLVFTHAYANASNCAPSRASLMSGSYSPRHGVFTVSPPDRGDARTRKLIPEPNEEFLSSRFKTLGNVFQEAGFKTAAMGKWHIGEDPTKQGFDVHKGGGRMGHPKNYFSPYGMRYLPDGPVGEELTDRITKESIRFMGENRTNDFFLYIPHFAIHTPLQGKKALVEKYRKLPARDGQGTNPDYAALVENLDQNVGKLLAAVKKLGLQNPLIIFSSDNGGIANLSRQWPLRGGKGSYYEGGIRVPLLVSQAGIKPGVSDYPTLLFDLFPTLCEWARVPPPTTQPIDGVSFLDVWQGKARPDLYERAIYFHFPFYLEAYEIGGDDSRDSLFRTRPGSVVIQNGWKLHHYFEDDAYELYDLENDPGERIDLGTSKPEKRDELANLLTEWRTATNAPIPKKPNPAYDPTFVPDAKKAGK
ncbi:sulfatase [Salmonirosea aquatica]|uniref:Sulfatase-like hydrolase/transferase n=1 Tax=Salmonirosea aquatica TaxID=2654236 RepID=A0A7C9BG56_9BACT|nr:sulfatase-like hydrolase/transferase [Cytophagaceae bacterium SJW1-29]